MKNHKSVKKVLFFALPGIGDALMMMPAMRAIKEAMPDVKLTVLTMMKPVQEIYQHYDDIDELLYWNFFSEPKADTLKFIWKLRQEKFDVSVMGFPSNRIEYSVISFMVGAKRRLGHKYLMLNASSGNWLYNETVQKSPERHNVEENFELVKLFLPKSYTKTKPDYLFFPEKGINKEFGEKYFKEQGIDPNIPVLGIHPGTSTLKNHIRRRWPPEFFKNFIQEITDLGIQVLIFGGPTELNLKEFIKGESKALVFSDKDICNTASVIQKIPYFISNDSGVMHLAASLGCEVIGIFGPTNQKYVYPYAKKYKIASLDLECSPCFEYSKMPLQCKAHGDYRCITHLGVEDVMNVLQDALNQS